VARQPLLVAYGLRGGKRLTASPLADVPPTTRVPLSPLGDPHASLYRLLGRATGSARPLHVFSTRPLHALCTPSARPMRVLCARPAGRTWHCRWMHESHDWTRLQAYDRDHVWHPYAPLPSQRPAIPVVSASGVRLRLADGHELVDAMASWWTAIWGYRHPVLDAAVQDQLGRMSHVMFGGLTHAPAIELAQRLVSMAPQGLENVFFADSGSVSVEVALKTAIQYQRNASRPEKARFLALSGGYHGDTFGAMSVCDPVGGMHHLFADVLPQQLFAPRPLAGPGVDPGWEAEVRDLVDRNSDQIAAVICEPIAQGAGGMWFYDPGYVGVLREVCDEYGLLLVLDEIATGFGRTGALFAADLAGISPDIMCVGKALTGGYMGMAAMLCTAEVAHVVSGGEAGCLMHGPTFMANPLACAAALASTGLLATGDWRQQVERVHAGLRQGLSPALALPGVSDVRVLGAIGVIQLDHQVDVAAATDAAVGRGAWVRPFRDLIYTMPAYVTPDADLATIGAALTAAAEVG
jgi:adenosylmethionine---8-amino-7-oxononanoate aminotransferase